MIFFFCTHLQWHEMSILKIVNTNVVCYIYYVWKIQNNNIIELHTCLCIHVSTNNGVSIGRRKSLWIFKFFFLYYFTSEQLLAPTGSLKQVDIARTADSIEESSPCFSNHFFFPKLNYYVLNISTNLNEKTNWNSLEINLFFPIENVSVFPGQTTPETARDIEINCRSHIEIQYISCLFIINRHHPNHIMCK